MTGLELKERRKKLKLTQTELAKRWNVNQSTISDWETGKVNIQHPKILDDAMKTVEREHSETSIQENKKSKIK